jgi:Tfp pilus assembly protein PilF
VKKSLFQKTFAHLILIAILGLIAYSNTFHVPFHFDDMSVIVENPLIKDLKYFIQPSLAKAFKEHFGYHTFRSRYVGYLTFALNYKFHGLDVIGYHVVNLLIHISNALLVYLLVKLTFMTPFLKSSNFSEHSGSIAFFTAILFVCHPIQTEAVTYIWQRVASLATMFYLLSLLLYIQWRLKGISADSVSISFMSINSVALYLTLVFSAVLAMKTKQTAFTLPVIIALYEFMFFRETLRKRIAFLLPLFLTIPIIPLTLIDIGKPWGDVIGDVGGATRDLTDISRLDYLFTQLRVIVMYIRLLFLPVNQNLNHDYTIYRSFLNPELSLSFLLLAVIFLSGVYVLYRFRDTTPHARLISFGIFWFFITLSVESSIIPIAEIICEYRVYLPSIGFFIIVSILTFVVMAKISEKSKTTGKALGIVIAVIVIILTGVTFKRNMAWKDEITLWQDVLRKNPSNARAYNNIGIAYESRENLEKAIQNYQSAVKIDPDYEKAHNNLGVVYQSKGLFQKAIPHYKTAIKINPSYAKAHNNLGVALKSLGFIDMAIQHLLIALEINQNYPEAHNNLGNAYSSQGKIIKAMKHYQKAIQLSPEYSDAYNNLANAFLSQGFFDKAIRNYEIAIRLSPDFALGHYNLGLAYQSRGLLEKADKYFSIARRLNPALFDKEGNQR